MSSESAPRLLTEAEAERLRAHVHAVASRLRLWPRTSQLQRLREELEQPEERKRGREKLNATGCYHTLPLRPK